MTGEGPVAIHAEAVDAQGNVDVADADVTVTVDTVPAPVAIHAEAVDAQGNVDVADADRSVARRAGHADRSRA
ncbi:hypothetical protein ECD94_04575, partial [Acinetobacter baumannii]|nr:hypothetical protein [Acinetobacter baumannii]